MDIYLGLKSRELDLSENDIKPIHVKRILEARSNDKDAKSFLDEVNSGTSTQPGQKTEQQKIREHFLLPDSELILERKFIPCFNEHNITIFQVTWSYLTEKQANYS